MNEVLMIMGLAITFSMVVMVARFFGKEGLTAFVAVATILANIFLVKQLRMFGVDATLGNVFFASTFLCTDIISECYGKKDALKAVIVGVFSSVGFVVSCVFLLLFVPNEFDYAHDAMEVVFSVSLKITIASVMCYFAANLADVYLFEKLKQMNPNALWLRNNVCTILCNCTENFALFFLAFSDIYTIEECILIAGTSSLIEAVIGICDTPFVYAGRIACKKHIAEQ